MRTFLRAVAVFSLVLPVTFVALAAPPDAASNSFSFPVVYFKLTNGLRIVLSPDHSAPTVVVAVYYRIGFRVEPKDRTGFAHLFEHMMFQGSQNLGKMEMIKLVQQNGGTLNGSTRFDFTNYFEIVPANKLETMLWAEADRMRGLAVTEDNLKNQQGVVGNEVKVNVLNRPYGGFPWLDMPQYANSNWYNAHNFYGDLKDIEAATLPDVQQFFKTYYAPNNAALAIVGDFDPAEARRFVDKYFTGIPSAPQPKQPDLTEPRQEKEKRASKPDPQAKRPALAVAYHMPARNTPEYYAMGLIDQISQFNGFGRADMLASFALFDDNPQRINDIESQFRKVTPTLIQKTAQEYLRPTNRTILTIEPKAGENTQAAKSGN